MSNKVADYEQALLAVKSLIRSPLTSEENRARLEKIMGELETEIAALRPEQTENAKAS